MIILDGIPWDVTPKIKRISTVKSSDLSGDMMDGSYFNDVLGQYLSFECEIGVPWYYNGGQYAAFYEALTAPVDGHTLIMPYNEGMTQFTVRVEVVEDEFVRRPGDRNYWRNTTVKFISNGPIRCEELGDILTRGRTPLPDLSDGVDGDYWHYESASGWVHGNYPDASDMYW